MEFLLLHLQGGTVLQRLGKPLARLCELPRHALAPGRELLLARRAGLPSRPPRLPTPFRCCKLWHPRCNCNHSTRWLICQQCCCPSVGISLQR